VRARERTYSLPSFLCCWKKPRTPLRDFLAPPPPVKAVPAAKVRLEKGPLDILPAVLAPAGVPGEGSETGRRMGLGRFELEVEGTAADVCRGRSVDWVLRVMSRVNVEEGGRARGVERRSPCRVGKAVDQMG
jgi:hypothetical protein